jgi:hypothetical protein
METAGSAVLARSRETAELSDTVRPIETEIV